MRITLRTVTLRCEKLLGDTRATRRLCCSLSKTSADAMNLFDNNYLQLRLEAMKMNQGSLQQLMTLSSAGLGLYFAFIGKAPFVGTVRALGVLVVLSWIVALCAAIIAHSLHGKLFISLCNLSSAAEQALSLEGLPDEVAEGINSSLDPTKLVAEAKAKLNSAREEFMFESQAFKAVFFPIQARTFRFTFVAFSAFVLGFFILGAWYILWTFSA